MAFDITPYIDKKPSEVRKLIREGVIDFPTAGMCRGYAQANLIILPPEYAGDFEEFAKRNPFPCPILEIIRGTPETHDMGEGGNICTDIPKYRIYRDGKWDGKELTDVSDYWKEGYVGFLIGCSFSFEETLMREGIEIRHRAGSQCTDVQDQYHDRAGRSVLRPHGLLYAPHDAGKRQKGV